MGCCTVEVEGREGEAGDGYCGLADNRGIGGCLSNDEGGLVRSRRQDES